jgi:hypothetical protein
MPYYNYMIIFDDGTTEIVQADNVVDAVESCDGDWYTRGVLSVIRMGYARGL